MIGGKKEVLLTYKIKIDEYVDIYTQTEDFNQCFRMMKSLLI